MLEYIVPVTNNNCVINRQKPFLYSEMKEWSSSVTRTDTFTEAKENANLERSHFSSGTWPKASKLNPASHEREFVISSKEILEIVHRALIEHAFGSSERPHEKGPKNWFPAKRTRRLPAAGRSFVESLAAPGALPAHGRRTAPEFRIRGEPVRRCITRNLGSRYRRRRRERLGERRSTREEFGRWLRDANSVPPCAPRRPKLDACPRKTSALTTDGLR